MSPRSNKTRLILIFLGLAALVALFVALLRWQDHSRRADLRTLRAEAPQSWLDDMRWREGFASYLDAVRDMRHFDAWHAEAPLFLIGRWAEEPTDRPGLKAALEPHCRAGYVFEDARLRRFGQDVFAAPARYRIDGDGLIRVESRGEEWLLLPDPNGPALRHLRLRTPDGTETDLLRCG